MDKQPEKQSITDETRNNAQPQRPQEQEREQPEQQQQQHHQRQSQPHITPPTCKPLHQQQPPTLPPSAAAPHAPTTLPPPPRSQTLTESARDHTDSPLTHVSMKHTDDPLCGIASNRLRRRNKCQMLPSEPITTVMNPLSSVTVSNQPLMVKNIQKDQLPRALSVQKQQKEPHHQPPYTAGDDQRIKRIVFNGTFPIDDPYSSRFENYAEEDEEAYDEYHDEDYDDYENDDDDDDEEAGDYYDDQSESGLSIPELARDKRYYTTYSRVHDP